MPKNKVSDPITDQEIAFARLVLSGGMTDRQAAEAVGLNPDSAAYTKAKPRVRAFMLEHRAAVQQQLLQQDADLSRRAVEELRPVGPDREQVLARLWELAHLSPEMTRNSITGQIKAISMIVAMQNFIPDRRALSAEKKSAPALAQPSKKMNSYPPRREKRLRPLAPASPPPPTALPPRKPRYPYPPVQFCSRPGSVFPYAKEPLCPPPLSCQIRKTTQKYRILQITEQATENSLRRKPMLCNQGTTLVLP